MATQFSFGNQSVKIPGAYSNIKSGVKNTPAGLDYGNVLVIDTGSGATWGMLPGILGEQSSGLESARTFETVQDMRNYMGGGLWFDLAAPLFRPSQPGIPGVSRLTFIKAATTEAAQISFTFTGGGANGGSIVFQTRGEGLGVNGVLDSGSTFVTKGFGAQMFAGPSDTFFIEFYKGTFRGTDPSSNLIGQAADDSLPEVVARSANFNNINQLYDWAVSNATFNEWFSVTYTPAGTGAVNAADLTANNTLKLAAGGTETYASARVEEAIEAIKNEPIDFILLDKWGADYNDTENLLIFGALAEMKYRPDIYVAAYDNAAGWADSITVAEFFNNQNVSVVHGGIKIPNRANTAFKNLPSIYNAAYILGREAGLEPQVPLTFKGIGISGLQHTLTKRELEQALEKGILAVRFDNGSFDILKGINSLQRNQFLLNEDGTSPSKQVVRIVRQLNKELAVNAKLQLLKQGQGVNRNTLSEEDLKNWIEAYLKSKVAQANRDNLILSFQDVVVTRNQDAYFAEYGVILNGEISFLFFTGTIVEI